jgi:hypothetical protein
MDISSRATLTLTLIPLVACSEAPRSGSTGDAPSSLAGAASAPSCGVEEGCSDLLSDLSRPAFKRLLEVRDAREVGKEMPTSLPSEIDYAPDIYTAIERATAEDKPIFLTSVVNKGGRKQAGCEV